MNGNIQTLGGRSPGRGFLGKRLHLPQDRTSAAGAEGSKLTAGPRAEPHLLRIQPGLPHRPPNSPSIPTPPPHTTQHRPSPSRGVTARAAPPAIGQTRHSATSAYRACAPSLDGGGGGRGLRGGRAGRGGLALRSPAPWSLAWVGISGRPRAGSATGAGRAAVTLVTALAPRGGCWRGRRRESPPPPSGDLYSLAETRGGGLEG